MESVKKEPASKIINPLINRNLPERLRECAESIASGMGGALVDLALEFKFLDLGINANNQGHEVTNLKGTVHNSSKKKSR